MKSRRTLFFALGAFLALFFPHSSDADIVRYIDENGTVHFSDRGGPWPFEIYQRIPEAKQGAKGENFGRNRWKYLPLIDAAGTAYGVDPLLIQCVIATESDFNPAAVSRKGARGLMQLMPSMAQRYRMRDIYDPRENIHVGTRHLKSLIVKYRGDLRLALAAYNAGEEAVMKYSGVPPFQETVQYVKRILGVYGKRFVVAQPEVQYPKKIYRYIGADGTVLITDTPRTAGNYN